MPSPSVRNQRSPSLTAYFPYIDDVLTLLRPQQPEIGSLLTHLDTDSSHMTALTHYMDVLLILLQL